MGGAENEPTLFFNLHQCRAYVAPVTGFEISIVDAHHDRWFVLSTSQAWSTAHAERIDALDNIRPLFLLQSKHVAAYASG